jgi:UPF0042 nucleotide-binding protein
MTGKKKKKLQENRFLIITGLSGSGKTVFSRFLEDIGFYCVDNLPSKLIPRFVELWERKEVELDRVALVADMREAGFLTEFPKVWEKIRKRIAAKLIFLEASDDTLIKRFSESRRPHPLSRKKSVMEAVCLERERLKDIKKMADEVIDTTEITISRLKKMLRRDFSKKKSQRMQVSVVSFGYKYGIPMDSDLVFDTRFLPNPFYIDELRDKTGKNQKVKDYVLNGPETKKFLGELYRFVDYLVPNFLEEDKSYLTISCGCTGGKHRSVIIAEALKEYLRKKKYDIRIYHRDMYK